MRLGFVGVGKHAERLAKTFIELGAEIVAHDRQSDAPGPEWAGKRVDWRGMVGDPNDDLAGIDGIVAVATPDVTTQVVRACLVAMKPCLATKPVTLEIGKVDWTLNGEPVSEWTPACGDFYGRVVHVDLWRLYSPAWIAMLEELRGKTIESIEVVCVGDGPVRSFSGVLDYGPHALAFVGDLLGKLPEAWSSLSLSSKANPRVSWEGYTWGGDEFPKIHVVAGNNATAPEMRVKVAAGGVHHEWIEDGGVQGYARDDMEQIRNQRNLALRSFCRAFLNGEPSDTLRLSVEAMRVLSKVVT